nr:MAG TPA: hypothetical protein [Caudoviricetes sp.]
MQKAPGIFRGLFISNCVYFEDNYSIKTTCLLYA